jgi:hypothetical protein
MINKYNYSVENIYYIIFILLGIFIITLSIYYIVMTLRFKHTAMVEKFVVNKEHPDNPNFRQCQVYFLNDDDGINNIAKCDEEYKKNPETTTCKYVYDGWQERADEVDENNNKITYKNKIFRNGEFDKRGIVNFAEDTRCFKELTEDISPSSNDNIHSFGNKNYLFQEFSTSDRLRSGGCDLKFPIQRTIKDMKFYKFILDTSNKIIDVKKVNIKADEMGFEIDTAFNISTFTSGQSYGIEYLREDKVTKRDIFRIFQISTFPPKPVNIHTFKYNYICDPNTQVIHKYQINAQLNIGSFIRFDESSSSVEYSFVTNLPCNCKTFQWTDFTNSDQKKKEDKRQLIIDKLKERRTEITDEINASLVTREEALKKELADIKTQEGCDITCLSQFKDNNKKISDILRRIFTTNKISSYKNELKYIKKEADMSNRVYDDIIIKVKNTFAPGLTQYDIDFTSTYLEYMVIFDDSIITRYNTSKDNGSVTDFTKLLLKKNMLNYFTGFFHAPITGNYTFKIKANNTSGITASSLFINNKRELYSTIAEDETKGIEYMKGDIVKIDICFARNTNDITYAFGWKITSNSYYNYNSTTGRNYVPVYFHKTETINSNNIVTSGDDTDKYVVGRFLMNPKIVPDETGDYYYEFKDTDLQYGIEFKKNTKCDILVVAGGGAGGVYIGGGGGAGGVLHITDCIIPTGIHNITIGKGGSSVSGATASAAINNGSSSKAFGIEVYGGGYGGAGQWATSSIQNGNNGGSGGGGGSSYNPNPGTGGSKVLPNFSSAAIRLNSYMYYGGNGQSALMYAGVGGWVGANGGGGAGGNAPANTLQDKGGHGADGVQINIDGNNYFWGGGGGGGQYLGVKGGNGGKGGGGGGNGAQAQTKSVGIGGGGGITKGQDGNIQGIGTPTAGNGGAHTGGGGGGTGRTSGSPNAISGNGGSGIVIIRVKMTGETIVSGIDFSKQNVLA